MQGTMTRRGKHSKRPQVFYGYCYRTGTMRMMDIDEYLESIREGYAQIQSYADQIARPTQYAPMRRAYGGSYGCGCGCGCDCDCNGGCCGRTYDSCCDCCVCDADVLIEARCSERRMIALTFSNDTRRERDVTLSVSSFTTASGRDLGWAAALSETKFHLGPCAEKTVQLAVNIDCSVFHKDRGSDNNTDPTTGAPGSDDRQRHDVDSCEVAYAKVSADGCLARPVLVAVAVLPNHCDSYVSSCKCGCC